VQLEERIEALSLMGDCLRNNGTAVAKYHVETIGELDQLIVNAHVYNGWFTEENVRTALSAISAWLCKDTLLDWIKQYERDMNGKRMSNRIGVIMAGNIPLVGFHDMLCVLITGNKFIGKLSSKDNLILPKITALLISINPDFKNLIEFAPESLENIDAIIATGSNNTSRYIDYYFGKYPNILRKNRNSVAVLNGKETEEEMKALGKDIFTYYGLGCRNVSKLYLPENYDLDKFFKGIFGFADVGDNKKYGNNYDYHKTILLMNKVDLIENGFLLLQENSDIASPVATLNYEYYTDEEQLSELLIKNKDQIQCIASNNKSTHQTVPLGSTQHPDLSDYADGIDTVKFLLNLN